MTLLCELGKKYGTDKYPHYTHLYDSLLYARRESTTAVLELGIGSPKGMKHVPNYQPGASLRMWREYFPHAMVIGVDQYEDAMVSGERLKSVLCNERHVDELCSKVGGDYDLIVDDGAHESFIQMAVANALVPRLKPDGLYIIEDVYFPEDVARELPFANCTACYTKAGGRAVLIQK